MPADDPALPGALLDQPGCYTTARVRAGQPSWPEYHCRRLRRDARALGLDAPDDAAILDAIAGLAQAEFGEAEGIVQLKACRSPLPEGPGTALVGTPRPLGPEPATWRATIASVLHPGPRATPGAKLTDQVAYAKARAISLEVGVDESLLLEAGGLLVEGARSNLLVVTSDGALASPDPLLGAVAGITLQILRERVPELQITRLGRDDLATARELIAVNAVRYAVPITHVDDTAIADGQPGPVSARLDAILAAG
jgi:branched-subunit amino acid aminotransferase/4-amino-4-deoxychorismate lyase